jgi:hypothetical protein
MGTPVRVDNANDGMQLLQSKAAMPDIDQLRRTYAEMSDEELLQLAVYEAADLIPEATEVLREEVCKRGFPDSVGVAIAAQAHKYTPEEIELLVARFREALCPICAATGRLLNAFRISTVKSCVVVSRREERLILWCSNCVERAATKASQVCVALGWWCFPWGPIYTISALLLNNKARAANAFAEPTQEFREYVLHNPGHVALVLKGGLEPTNN